MLRRLRIIGPFEFPQWLGVPSLAIISIIVVQVWRILPFATVITLAGMTAVPRELIEAALVDGAGFFTRLFRITLPNYPADHPADHRRRRAVHRALHLHRQRWCGS